MLLYEIRGEKIATDQKDRGFGRSQGLFDFIHPLIACLQIVLVIPRFDLFLDRRKIDLEPVKPVLVLVAIEKDEIALRGRLGKRLSRGGKWRRLTGDAWVCSPNGSLFFRL